MKARYLAFFSYIGTTFRSSEKLWHKANRNHPDPESVQGLLELALLKLRPLNYPHVTLSSRTDGGVHALNASAHVDLERHGTGYYTPEHLVYSLNKYFFKTDITINVKKIYRVPDTFSARFNAVRRTYLYRLAVLKPDKTIPENCGIGAILPIEEWRRCHFVRYNPFNIELLKEGSKYLVGLHDWTTFKKFDKLLEYKHNRREIYSIDVQPGRPLITSYSEGQEGYFDYWDIEIKGKAFVHNQIRRMMGTLIAVAIGKLPPEEIKVMLQVPSKNTWPNLIQCCPPMGLYLCDVEYRPEDLILEPSEENSEKVAMAIQEKSDSECVNELVPNTN